MRIIGTIDHPVFKISIFSWNEKYIVKIEAGLFEQSYKFRQDDFKSADELKEFFDSTLLHDINETFRKMSGNASEAAQRFTKRSGYV